MNYIQWERKKLSVRKFKRNRKKVLRKFAKKGINDYGKLSDEKSLFSTTWSVFKEAFKFSPKEVGKTVAVESGIALVQGAAPMLNGLMYGSVAGLISGAPNATNSFIFYNAVNTARQTVDAGLSAYNNVLQQNIFDKFSNYEYEKTARDIINKPRVFSSMYDAATIQETARKSAQAKANILKYGIYIASSVGVMGCCVASSFVYSPAITAAIVGATFVSMRYKQFTTEKFKKRTSRVNKENKERDSTNSDYIQNRALVQDASKVAETTTEIRENIDKNAAGVHDIRKKRTWREGLNYVFMNLGIQSAIAIAGYKAVIKANDIAPFGTIISAGSSLHQQGNWVNRMKEQLHRADENLTNANDLLRTPKEFQITTGNEKLSRSDTKISVNNVTFAYPDIENIKKIPADEVDNPSREIAYKEDVLNNMNIEFDKGELTVIVGESGNGKSTLVNLIRHDYDIQEGRGEILIGNKDVKSLSIETLRNQIVFADQSFHLFNKTLEDNLRFFKSDATKEELEEACKVADVKMELSKEVGIDGANASGGEGQRIAIARAILSDSPILILDEPTSKLDRLQSIKIVKNLKKLSKDKTVIVITHDPDAIAMSDRCVVINNRRIEADGPTRQIKENNDYIKGILSATYGEVEDAKIVEEVKETLKEVEQINPNEEIKSLVTSEAEGVKLSDEERKRKQEILKEHKDIFVRVRKGKMAKNRVKKGVDAKEGDYVQKLANLKLSNNSNDR